MLHHALLLSLSLSLSLAFYRNLSLLPTPPSIRARSVSLSLSLPNPSARREQTVALISLGLIPSHFLKDFNYCLLYLRLISANACISLARAYTHKHAHT